MSLFYKPIWPGYGQRTPQLIVDECAKIGHEVTMYTGRIPQEMQTDEKQKLKKYHEKMGNGSVDVSRIWTPNVSHEGYFKRSIVYSIFVTQCFFKILFSRDVDLIIGLHPYPPFLIPIMLVAKLRNVKFLLKVGDLWPYNLRELGVVKNDSLFFLIKKLSYWAYNLADKIIIITSELKQWVLEKFPIEESKIVVLNLATDTKIFRPLENVSSMYEDKFVVMYCGIFSPNYDFDIILNSAKITKNKRIIYVLAGSGELKSYIRDQIAKRKLENVILENPVKDLRNFVEKMNRADILLLGMNNNMQSKTAHPSKIFEYMACGKPIVSSCIGAVRELIVSSKCGIVVEPQNYEAFLNAITRLSDSSLDREKMGKNGVEYINEHYSLDIFRRNLDEILNKVN